MHTAGSAFAAQMRESLFVGSLDHIAAIDLDAKPSPDDMLPPARFSLTTQPFYYQYRQNPSVAVVSDAAGPRVVNRAVGPKVVSALINWADPVPRGPPAGIDTAPREPVRRCIARLRVLFAERPCYTRRALQAKLDPPALRQLKHALPHVAYFYRSGPWRSAYIRYGEDPRADPAFAPYQVEHFRIASDAAADDQAAGATAELAAESGADAAGAAADGAADANSADADYRFTGTRYPSVPMLQLCDIADGFLESYVATRDLRSRPDANDGWYPEHTMAVIRRVLRAQLVSLHDTGRPLPGAEKTRLAESVQWDVRPSKVAASELES